MQHQFVICAYKESPYLEECLQSVLNQKKKSNVILATSTPNDFIDNLCKKYNIKMYINHGESGITQDWNFAYSVSEADYVTIVHQDDIYTENYLENVMGYLNKAKKPMIFFSDYAEHRNGQIVTDNKLLKIKRMMLLPLRNKSAWNNRFLRRRVLSLGNPICCPSVTFVRNNCPKVLFANDYISNEDWQAWEKLSKREGAFVYCRKVLMYHRIHEDSTTSKVLENNGRTQEDYEMFCLFWPKPIAKLFTKVYGKSEDSNKV